MATRLTLQPKERDNDLYGRVIPIVTGSDGKQYHGKAIGYWFTKDGVTEIELLEDTDTIKHEVATREAVTSEIRASNKDANGTVWPTRLEYDPKTHRFKQFEVRPNSI